VIQEFKEFVNKGNFVDLAVGFVMGLAVAGVVTALVERLVMPLIALIVGQPNFDAIGTFGDVGSVGAVVTALVNFLLIALVSLTYQALGRLLAPYFGPESEEIKARLVSGVTGNVTMETNIRMWDLARGAASSPVARAELLAGDANLHDRLERTPEGRQFARELDRYARVRDRRHAVRRPDRPAGIPQPPGKRAQAGGRVRPRARRT
jgi:large conductance mechanosensitive channel protein